MFLILLTVAQSVADLQFMALLNSYMEHLARLDSRGSDPLDICSGLTCNSCGWPKYQCTECHSGPMLCQVCVVDTHIHLLFHRVQVREQQLCVAYVWLILLCQRWTRDYFESSPLKELGVVLPLLHGSAWCPSRVPGSLPLMVFHCNGFHAVAVKYCNCPGALLLPAQLLRSHLWPGTEDVPHTAGTFDLLRLFQTMDHRAHVNNTDMYHALELMTDGYGLKVLPVCPFCSRVFPALTQS
jgi:hypothetical protein